jgi:hypothetical protein
MILFIAFAIIGVIGIFAAAYLFTSRQGKLQSRRIFWGEAAFFLAESLINESFAVVKCRSKDPNNSDFGGGAWLKNATNLDGELKEFDLPVTDYSSFRRLLSYEPMGLTDKDIKIHGRAIVTDSKESGGSDNRFVDDAEKVGVMEFVVTVVLPIGKTKVTRQIMGRRDFRFINISGKNALHNYALFLKKQKNNVQDISGASGLVLARDNRYFEEDVDQLSFGRIYLGQGENNTDVSVIQSTSFSAREAAYFESTERYGKYDSTRGSFRKEISDYEDITPIENPYSDEDDLKNSKVQFAIDSMLQDPNVSSLLNADDEARAQLESLGIPAMFKFSLLSDEKKEILRTAYRGFLEDYFLSSSARIDFDFYPSYFPYKSLKLGIDYQASKAKIEGKVLRLYGFEGEVRYEGEFLSQNNPENRYVFFDMVNASHIFTGAGETSTFSVFEGLTGAGTETPQSRLESAQRYLSYINPKAFSYVFVSEGGRSAWQNFKAYNVLSSEEQDWMTIDGVMLVVGDVIFDKPTVYEGSGVLMTTGSIQIRDSLRKAKGIDSLTLVTRGNGMKAAVTIDTPQKIEAHIQAHQMGGYAGNATLSALSKFELYGGLSLDTVEINDLPDKSRVEYDPVFACRVDTLSISGQYNFFKIYNYEKEVVSN